MIHDIIKINLSRSGYLPDYPPHLISDKEMCDAFLNHAGSEIRSLPDWFHDNYPEPPRFVIGVDSSTGENVYSTDAYADLEQGIYDALSRFVDDTDINKELPNWVYAYMLASVVGPNSDIEDRHNMLVLMGLDNIDDEITPDVYRACYKVSKQWLAKHGERRPIGIFIEPHIVKYYRLISAV